MVPKTQEDEYNRPSLGHLYLRSNNSVAAGDNSCRDLYEVSTAILALQLVRNHKQVAKNKTKTFFGGLHKSQHTVNLGNKMGIMILRIIGEN